MLVLLHNQFDKKNTCKDVSPYYLHLILPISMPFNQFEQKIHIPFTYWHFSIC